LTVISKKVDVVVLGATPTMKLGAVFLALLAVTSLVPVEAWAEINSQSPPMAFTSFLRKFLDYRSETGADPATQVIVRGVDLGASNKEAYVAYVKGGGWCGSGGCNTLIAVRRGAAYKVLAFVPATELPIILLPSYHGGGRDVAVTLKGVLNGDHFDPPTRAILSLRGSRYRFGRPRSASAPFGIGEVLIPADAKAAPLNDINSR